MNIFPLQWTKAYLTRSGHIIPRQSKTDWHRLKKMTEEEIDRNALADPDAKPTDEAFWMEAEVKILGNSRGRSARGEI